MFSLTNAVLKLILQTFSSGDVDALSNIESLSTADAFLVHLVRQARYDSGLSPSNDCMTARGYLDDQVMR